LEEEAVGSAEAEDDCRVVDLLHHRRISFAVQEPTGNRMDG
jgi:hypothetical protein